MYELSSITYTAGGLGLFLLGMIIMTENLKRLAGNHIRSALFNFTKTPITGAITGALATAVIQSSSATTVAAVGFVNAGLMRFSNALGIIFGANLGTTITGWMVVILGFKLSIGALAFPVVLLGTLLRLFAKGNWAYTGSAIAGFGLIFIGISTLQDAMIGMRDMIDFTQLPASSFLGQLQLLFLGLIFTILTQSSSAGVALTITALFTNLIQFDQAAALVIGMDVGTTFTSLMATIGGTVSAKRTGYSHVIYNMFTAVFALLLISPYTHSLQWLSTGILENDPEIALVGFHTLFNALGVVLVLPFTQPFSRLIKKIVPQKSDEHIYRLEPQLIQTPELALRAVQDTLIDLSTALLNELHVLMSGSKPKYFYSNLQQLQEELDQTQIYLDRIHLTHPDSHLWKRLINMIHTLDHLQRLHERCEEESDRAEASKQFPSLIKFSQRLEDDVQSLQGYISKNQWNLGVRCMRHLYHFIRQDTETYRHKMVKEMGKGDLSADQCWESLEAIRWMERVSKHLYRISYYIEKMLLDSGK